jgi:hypothetical protein
VWLGDGLVLWPPAMSSAPSGSSAPPASSTSSGSLQIRRQNLSSKILFFAVYPVRIGQLSVDEESREIELTIRGREADHQNVLEFVIKSTARLDDLLRDLDLHRPLIVHFSGQGNPTDEIILLDPRGEPGPFSNVAIKQLFRSLKYIRVVVLDACFSRPQAEAITEMIDCAVGMKKAVGYRGAIVFATSFYRAIGFGLSVQDAFQQGKTGLCSKAWGERKTCQNCSSDKVLTRRAFFIGQSAGTAPGGEH